MFTIGDVLMHKYRKEKPKRIVWMGTIPTKCQTCDNKIVKTFYDMATTAGPWAIMCPTCAMLGPGIGQTGTGMGQRYERQGEDWVKTEG